MSDPQPTPTLRPATWQSVVTAAVVGAAGTGLVLMVLSFAGASLSGLGASAWAPVALLAAATGWVAWRTRAEVRAGRRPEPDTGLLRVRVAKAAAWAGAAVAGGYAVVALAGLGSWGAPLGAERVISAAIASVLGVVWTASGLVLQRLCRLPDEP